MTLDEAYAEIDRRLTPPNAKGCVLYLDGNLKRPLHDRRLKVGDVSRLVKHLILERKIGRPMKPGMWALHTCDNYWCHAEAHLYEGTVADNNRDTRNRYPGYKDMVRARAKKRELNYAADKLKFATDPEYRAKILKRRAKARAYRAKARARKKP